jgi:hypothetical protein
MRVVFIQYGPDIQYAQLMVNSVKKLGYHITQLSCPQAPKVNGANEVIRRPMKEGRMLFRARFLADQQPPYVMLDTDMIVARDISEGFGGDVALTWRAKHMVLSKDEKEPLRMPYNGGVIFVQNQSFMEDCLEEMERMPPKRQDWYGDQLALVKVAESGKYKVKELRDETWNFCPDSRGHDIPNVKIYHYKGWRKPFMAARA